MDGGVYERVEKLGEGDTYSSRLELYPVVSCYHHWRHPSAGSTQGQTCGGPSSRSGCRL